MNTINVNDLDLYKFKRLKTDVNNESKIFVNKNRLYKLLFNDCITKKREENIEKLSNFKLPNCVFPDNKIINNYGEFVGIEEEYLKGYKTLGFYLNHNYLEYEKRKLIAHKLCEIQRLLDNNSISFVDMHTHNIMINNDDIKVIDLDSAEVINEKNSEVFDYLRRDLICRNLAVICYQALFGYDINIYKVRKERLIRLLSKSNDKQKEFLNKVYKNNGEGLLEVEDYIDEFDEYFMEESKLILKI